MRAYAETNVSYTAIQFVNLLKYFENFPNSLSLSERKSPKGVMRRLSMLCFLGDSSAAMANSLYCKAFLWTR